LLTPTHIRERKIEQPSNEQDLQQANTAKESTPKTTEEHTAD
jgi:hypothetical protein